MAEIKMDGYLCERCLHAWIPRDNEMPTVCPKCKSPYWNKPKEGKSTSESIQAWHSLMQKKRRS